MTTGQRRIPPSAEAVWVSSSGAQTPVSATGLIAYEFRGSACEGYTSNFRQMTEMERSEGEPVSLILVIHKATNAQMTSALEKIAALPCVKKAPRMIRVENFA